MFFYKTCLICGAELPPIQNTRGDGIGIRFCSKECVEKWHAQYDENPFVNIMSAGRIAVNNRFIEAARPFIGLGETELFKIFEIDTQYISRSQIDKALSSIKRKKDNTHRYDKSERDLSNNNTALRIMLRRMCAMEKMVDDSLKQIGDIINQLSTRQKKELCLTLSQFPRDPGGHFTTTYICSTIHISLTCYYQYIHNEEYGITADLADKRDEKIVREAYEYKGYPKGVRQVYMLIPRLSKRKIGLDRVRNIMRKYGT